MALAGEEGPHVPAHLVEAEQRQHHVVAERLFRKQGENLVRAREAEMHALLRRQLEQFLTEQLHGAGIGREIAGDEIEQRGFSRAVRSDDQPPLAGHHRERDLLGGGQAAEALVEVRDFERNAAIPSE